jgi:hypothetical protein
MTRLILQFLVCLLLCSTPFDRTFGQGPCSDWPFDPASIANSDLILTPNDTVLCGNATVRLRTKPVSAFCWSPTLYLNDPTSANPVASPPSDITYFFTSKETGNNLIVNGDFSGGNAGFISGYEYNSNGLEPGRYFVSNNPAAWHPNMPSCSDHTTGSGNMMLVNGANVAGVQIWSKTISVTPATLYEFACWVTNVSSVTVNLCQLQFYINNVPVGNVFQSEPGQCSWKQFFSNWNSGSSTSATISIVNQSTQFTGNDFALDDISFAPIAYKQDSVRILLNRNCIVPINIKDFRAQKVADNVRIEFETFNEVEIVSIKLERASDNMSFSALDEISLKGNGKYLYTDHAIGMSGDRVFYRMKVLTKNGDIFYSEVKSVFLGSKPSTFYLVNNLVRKLDELIVYSSFLNKDVSVSIVDASGRILVNRKTTFLQGENRIAFGNSYLANGVYFVSIMSNNSHKSFKFVVY